MISVDSSGSPGDWTLVGFTIAAAIPFLFANAVIVVYRHRIYFRAQGGVDLILGSSVSGLIWVGSSFVQNGHLRRGTRILQMCHLWSFWLQLSLGFCLWLVCFIMRLHRLQTLSSEGAEQEKAAQMRAWTVLIPLFLTPALSFSVLATIKHIMVFHNIQDSGDSCQYINTTWKLVGYLTLPIIYISTALLFLYKLRGRKNYMLISEYRHTCEVVGMIILLYLLSGILYLSQVLYEVAGRCFLTFCVCSMVYFDFWLHMGRPVFLCLFRPKFEMDNLEERSGANVFLGLHRVASVNMPSCEIAILEAVSATIAKLECYKAEKEELEKEKAKLIGKIDELRRKLGISTISL